MDNAQMVALGSGLLSLALRLGWLAVLKNNGKNRAGSGLANGWRTEAIHFCYYAGLPYLAVILGIVTPRLLGLTGLEYFAAIGWGDGAWGLELQQALTLLLLDWLLDSPATVVAGTAALLALALVWSALGRSGAAFDFPRQSARETLYDAIHWAFYRAIFWAATADLYLGAVLGAGFALLEEGAAARLQGLTAARQQQFLAQTMILLLTAGVFYYIPNLWLLLPVHWAMALLVNRHSQPNRPTRHIRAMPLR